MGSKLSCMEKGTWDHAHHIKGRYKAHRKHGHQQQDMTQPLSHYFISSGHNSYLQGNQLTSTAGTNTIEQGLRHGCRVVELDVYDGPTEPVVTHGGTLTSSVTFKECVKAVAKNAFHTSSYPVILTIENHVKQQQDQMVETLTHELGHHLFIPDDAQLTREGKWLSPEQLKSKVVVRMKVKPGLTSPELTRLVYICNSSIKSYDAGSGPAVPSSHSLPDNKLPLVPEYAGFTAASKMFSFTTPQAAQAAEAAEAGEDPEKIAKDYVAATHAAKKEAAAAAADKGQHDQNDSTAVTAASGGKSAAAKAPVNGDAAAAADAPALSKLDSLASCKSSFEQVVKEEALQEEMDDTLRVTSSASTSLAKPDLATVLRYTSKHLLRCYPSAWRMVDNSNPNPAAAWGFGVSLAALNWQLWDQALWVNEAFFSQHGNSGYVLKPEWMRNVNPQQPLPPRSARTLNVHVFSAFRPQGHRMGVFKDDMYVELRVIGMPQDTATHSSPHKNNTGRLVVDQDFKFDVLYPEMAVLVVLLKDQDSVMADTVLGYSSLALADLAPGAYSLPLADPKVIGGNADDTGMWVKVQLGWQDAAADATTQDAAAAAAT